MKDSCFAGTAHFAPSDTIVTISNDGGLPHTLTAVDGSFDTGLVEPGSSAELSFDEPGIYRFFCTLHGTAAGEGMAGVLVVGEPEPETMATSLDTSAFVEAVAQENEDVFDAIRRQGSVIADIRAAQRDTAQALDSLAVADSSQLSNVPQIVTTPVEPNTEMTVLAVAVGLATGLAIAALVSVLWLRRREADSSGLERLQPTAET